MWIRDLLEGADRELATSIWQKRGGGANPRYTGGAWNLVCRYVLLVANRDGWLTLTDSGRDFLDNEAGKTVTRLDKSEGLLDLLRLIADKRSAPRQDLLPEWDAYLRASASPFRSPSTRRSSLEYRLKNLSDRGLVATVGRDYRITTRGWLHVSRAYPRNSTTA